MAHLSLSHVLTPAAVRETGILNDPNGTLHSFICTLVINLIDNLNSGGGASAASSRGAAERAWSGYESAVSSVPAESRYSHSRAALRLVQLCPRQPWTRP